MTNVVYGSCYGIVVLENKAYSIKVFICSNGQPSGNILFRNTGWSDISLFFFYLSSRASYQNRNMDHIKVYCPSVFQIKGRQNLNRDYKVNLIESNEFKILFNKDMRDQFFSVLDCWELERPKKEITQYSGKTKSLFIFCKSSKNNVIMTFHFEPFIMNHLYQSF